MRVTHIITRLIVGGAQENTIASVLGLHEKSDLEVRLIAGPTEGPEGSLESDVSRIPGLFLRNPHLIRSVNPWKDFMALRELVREFRNHRPEIVHTHSGKAGILGRWAAKRAGVPIIIHSIHGPSFGPFQGPVANWTFRSAERWAGRWTTQFVTVAEAMTRQYLAAGIGSPDQYRRIFSGFDLAAFLQAGNDLALRVKLGIQPGDFVVGKVARLFKLKGHDDLFQVMPRLVQRIPNIRFLLVGDGAWRERFAGMAASLGLESRVVFTGLLPPSAIPSHMGIMDALVHLSLREGLPRALPQALAAGKPVVAYDCDGAGEVCLEGKTGFLVARHHLDALADALERLAADSELRTRLGETGRDYVRRNFSIQSLVQSQYDLYQSLRQPRKQAAPDAAPPV